MEPKALYITKTDITAALARVEAGRAGVDDANLLRAYLAGLEGRLRTYELGDDDREIETQDFASLPDAGLTYV